MTTYIQEALKRAGGCMSCSCPTCKELTELSAKLSANGLWTIGRKDHPAKRTIDNALYRHQEDSGHKHTCYVGPLARNGRKHDAGED